jgi:cell division protein FtsB
MSRPPARPTDAESEPDRADRQAPEVAVGPAPGTSGTTGSLSDLPVAGLTRRRIALLLGALVAAWVVVLFARQVGEASAATTQADDMRASNVTLQAEVAAAQRELAQIQQPAYIAQQAREYRLGDPREIPFIIADDAPPLGADAPGSAAVRLGAVVERRSPIDSWLDLLFGSPDQPQGDAAIPTG